MEKRYSILNFSSVIGAIAVTYYAQAVKLNGNSMISLSAKYNSLFTPEGYAFAIWGLIYLSLLTFSGYQLYQAFGLKKHTEFLVQTKYWFSLANLANMCWIFAWYFEYTGLSVLFMLVILFSLIKIILNTNMERWDAPFRVIASSWWPICLYSGWIAVATIANISAYLVKLNWDGVFLSEIQWTIVMIFIATLLNLLMIYKRNMREFAAVGIWALLAIYVRHSGEISEIAYSALIGAILIGIYAAYHGFINRKQNPMYQLMK
ncbi:tryptophan-rich sensory protein [Mesonia aquimarina]|uniref:tryptophan-rich sensory protein n=1 Tax=Mesonia aquimarina TaxID=1504967 RepID=UPI000EF5C94F|nr:tryptophan-rich sensory protein [Mesonia aquimarina]